MSMSVKPELTRRHSEILNGPYSPDDTFIAVMGVTGAGKSTFISKCCQEAAEGIGHSLKSMTQEIGIFTFTYNKRKIHLIDTPGFDDTYRTDSDVLRDLAYWLSASYGRGFKLTGIIYLHPITATRMSGSAFKNLRTFRKLCGKQSMSSIVLATTMWSSTTTKEGDVRETDLKDTAEFWGDMIREGSMTYRHTGDHHSAMNIISWLLNRHTTTVLGLQSEMVDQKKSLDNTEAGREVESEMIKERERFENRLAKTKEEMEEAIANNDRRHIEEIAREQENFQNKIDNIQKGREELKISMERLIQEKERQHQEEMAEIDRKLCEQREETEKNIREFQEYKEFSRQQQELEDEKKAAMEAELDSVKEQAERSDAASIIILTQAIEALKVKEEEALAREKDMIKQMEMKEARAAEAMAQQAALQRQQAEMALMQQFSQQQQQQQQQLQAQQLQQQQQQNFSPPPQYSPYSPPPQPQYQSQDASFGSGALGGVLTGSALLGTAMLSGCSIM